MGTHTITNTTSLSLFVHTCYANDVYMFNLEFIHLIITILNDVTHDICIREYGKMTNVISNRGTLGARWNVTETSKLNTDAFIGS